MTTLHMTHWKLVAHGEGRRVRLCPCGHYHPDPENVEELAARGVDRKDLEEHVCCEFKHCQPPRIGEMVDD